MLKDIGQFLNKSFQRKTYQQGHDIDTLHILKNWEKIVGPKLVAVSLPQRIFKETLYVVVNHSAYAHHLNQISEQILNKIEHLYPNYKNKIKSLRFIFSEKAFEEIDTTVVETPRAPVLSDLFNPHDPQYRKYYKEALSQFQDLPDEMKESLISIYIQNKMIDSPN